MAPLLFYSHGRVCIGIPRDFCCSHPEPPPPPQRGREESGNGPFSLELPPHRARRYRHLLLCRYRVGIPRLNLFYLASVTGSAAVAGGVAAICLLLMLCGRMISSAISSKVSSRTQLITVSITALAFICIAIFLSDSSTINMPSYPANEGFSIVEVPTKPLRRALRTSAHR